MENIQILQMLAGILGGGAVGAFITATVTSFKTRIQPIGTRVEISPLFTASFGGSGFKANITASDGTLDYKFPNLHLAEIEVVNRGNRDLERFSFGATLVSSDMVVHVDPRGEDRHHIAALKSHCTLSSPSSQLDFELSPFNRGDVYTIRLFVVVNGKDPGKIDLSTSEPVRFTEMPSAAEALSTVLKGSILKFGPVSLRVGL